MSAAVAVAAGSTDAPWETQAFVALHRAQEMSEAIRAIAELVQDERSHAKIFSLMSSVVACTQSIDALVDPLVDAGVPQ